MSDAIHRFSVGDTVEWDTNGKLYKATVIDTSETEFTITVFFPIDIPYLNYSYPQTGWKLSAPIEKGKLLCDKIKTMYERQPHVQRIKQLSSLTNFVSSLP